MEKPARQKVAHPIFIIGLVSVALAIGYFLVFQVSPTLVNNANTFNISGTVTMYDETPTYTDGPIAFQIDGQSIDIGGGQRAGHDKANTYSPIAVGDQVEARVMRGADGGLTVYGCGSCFVRKK